MGLLTGKTVTKRTEYIFYKKRKLLLELLHTESFRSWITTTVFLKDSTYPYFCVPTSKLIIMLMYKKPRIKRYSLSACVSEKSLLI